MNHPMVRSLLIPLLWLVALPAFGLWFGGFASSGYDALVQEGVLQAIAADATLDEASRAQFAEFYRQNPSSAVCRSPDPELAELRTQWADLCGDHQQLGWIQWMSAASLGIGGIMVSVALLSVGIARRSSGGLVPAFFLGWNVLRAGSAAQIVLQGALAVLLSYWVTAYFMSFYAPKLILLVGLLALFAVGAALKALFTRLDLTLPIEGRAILEADAPGLWARVREIASSVGTAAPDRIVAGIDDNFFVTEGEVSVDGTRHRGRTLYVSLSLLRALSRSEADAVLAHEMAHFSGGDTARSRRLTPGLARASNLLQAMHDQIFGLPAFHVLGSFFEQFVLAIARHDRDRELRADAIAARVVAPEHLAHALLKVGAYASYRARVENSLFQASDVHTELKLADRVRVGFDSYARSHELVADLRDGHVPHPTDSHPPMVDRLVALGVELDPSAYEGAVLTALDGGWVDEIHTASAVESELWAAYEQRFLAAHEFDLAVRYVPETDEERTIVLRHFPERTFPAGGGVGAVVSFEALTLPEVGSLGWGEITSMGVVETGMFSAKALAVGVGSKVHTVPLKPFGSPGSDELLGAIDLYWRRHQAMCAHQIARSGGES